MLHKSLIKALERIELKIVKTSSVGFFASNGKNTISWFVHAEDSNPKALCVNVRKNTDENDYERDYTAGIFTDILSSALAMLNS